MVSFCNFERGVGSNDVFDMSPSVNNGIIWGMDNNLSWVTGFNSNPTSIAEDNNSNRVNTFPSPTSGIVTIDIRDVHETNLIIVSDM